MLDETEAETVPGAASVPAVSPPLAPPGQPAPAEPTAFAKFWAPVAEQERTVKALEGVLNLAGDGHRGSLRRKAKSPRRQSRNGPGRIRWRMALHLGRIPQHIRTEQVCLNTLHAAALDVRDQVQLDAYTGERPLSRAHSIKEADADDLKAF